MSTSKIARYPAIYSRILLALPADGKEIVANLASHEAAVNERLRFYTFLKFLRRNPSEAAQFANRQHNVMISVNGSALSFRLRTATLSDLESALDASIPAIEGNVSMVPDFGHELDVAAMARQAGDAPPVNPLEVLNAHLEGKDKAK